MANPIVPQGNLNRLRGSLTIANFVGLNITAPFLGKEGISLSFDTPANAPIETMTGIVNSPEPYQKVTVSAHLIKSQGLANAWKLQLENLAILGNMTVYPDTATLSPYAISYGSIMNVNPLKFNGTDAEWVVMLTGIYFPNSQLWNF